MVTQTPLLTGSTATKTSAPLALGFSFAEDTDSNGLDRTDEKSSNTDDNKGIIGYNIPIVPVLTTDDAVAAAKKVPPLIASKKVHFK
jgi:hypothetical protein